MSTPAKQDLRQRCYAFCLRIISLANSLPNTRAAWVIADQVIRSGTSVGANLVEAKGSSSRREFKRFNEIALKSTNETIYWLGLLRDSKLVDGDDVNLLLAEASEIARMLAAGVITLQA